jgi:uncharacterized protein YndB with AHSA1/START domain
MTPDQETPRVVSASREIAAEPGRIFELIADPAQWVAVKAPADLAWASAVAPGSALGGR